MDRNLAFRSVNEEKDGDSQAKISSVSGANRKRRWKEEEDEEEEQKAKESSDLETSSDDDDGDDVQEKQLVDPDCSSQEEKPEVMQEEEKTEKDGKTEERNSDQGKIQSSQHQKPSQPVVFVPVDRLPEIQVCKGGKTQPHMEYDCNSNSCLLSFGTWM